MFLDPGKKGLGIVEAETDFRMLFEVLDEGKIACGVGLLENMVEIAAGLVRVNEQREMKFLRHGGSFSHLHDNPTCKFMNSNRCWNLLMTTFDGIRSAA